ncbi:MAG: ArnT family glycosyltransferase [Gaiellaceae bacterium]
MTVEPVAVGHPGAEPVLRGRTFAVAPVLAVAAAKTILQLSFASRYGWHRDTLYYAVAGLHLQGGYVEFTPVTALVSALARTLFGWSLVGFRLFPILAGAATVLVGARITAELGGSRRAQTLAAVLIAFSPVMLGTNGLFQPVSFDQLAWMIVFWLAVRLALGHGSWLLLGVAAGVGLETKYSIAVPLVLLIATFAIWRRDVLRTWRFPAAVGIAALLLVPDLLWQAGHDWVSVHWFLHPPPSGSDETRPQYIFNTLLLTQLVAVPVAVAGVVALVRDRALRPFGWTIIGTVVAFFVVGGKSYYALPAVLFAVAAGALSLDRWATRRRLIAVGAAYLALDLALLPLAVPILPLKTAEHWKVVNARGDYQDEIGWPGFVRQIRAHAKGANVIVTQNYGEAGALEILGHGLPPVASGDVTFRYWRPRVTGRQALIVGFPRKAPTFCRDDYRIVGTIHMPVDNDERGDIIARCTLASSLARVWPQILRPL